MTAIEEKIEEAMTALHRAINAMDAPDEVMTALDAAQDLLNRVAYYQTITSRMYDNIDELKEKVAYYAAGTLPRRL